MSATPFTLKSSKRWTLHTTFCWRKYRCLNFTQIDETLEDNKEPKAYSLKLSAERTLRRETLRKLQDEAGGGVGLCRDPAVKLRNIARLELATAAAPGSSVCRMDTLKTSTPLLYIQFEDYYITQRVQMFFHINLTTWLLGINILKTTVNKIYETTNNFRVYMKTSSQRAAPP